MTTMVYGIKNCDTIKKALKWLEAEDKAFTFHDYRKDGIDQDMLKQFVEVLGWEAMLNKRGTTFRALSEEQKSNLDETNAVALMLVHPAMIKRPLLAHNGNYYLGFKPDEYTTIFSE
ncbi:arsenate reductase [Enterovibrio norvegicus FF-33]|uniref:Arsenate reductase n=1 Tax=Enterovibrio norvegicus FF-454 TaxID=1185651 RepID=A0A1E5C614_9GAMM|nr:ArsC family reductase [Enterovibrio norvegicus]OEE60964.1 arsenate reductase [Enterovibrio norvegicus FF-454]OEE68238.1 arsenate reductase [Enterovibrio norvegicus FF-33]OEE74996.1 arsenate reductase [Enterovibrio norvegicus FF-162]